MLSLVGPQATDAVAALGVTGLAAPEVLAVPGPKFRRRRVPARPDRRGTTCSR